MTPGERAARAVETCFDAMIEAQIKSVGHRKSVRYRSRKAERQAREEGGGRRDQEEKEAAAAATTVTASAGAD